MKLTTTQAKWLRFLDRCRLRYWLTPLPHRVRRSIEMELDEQATETFSYLEQADELARLEAVYRRRGAAAEYLPELVGKAAWSIVASRIAGLQRRASRPNIVAAMAGTFLLQLVWLVGASAAVFVFVLSIASVLWPAHVGIFEVGVDHYQLRLFSEPINANSLFTPWLGLSLATVSGLVFTASMRQFVRAALLAFGVLRSRLMRDECE